MRQVVEHDLGRRIYTHPQKFRFFLIFKTAELDKNNQGKICEDKIFSILNCVGGRKKNPHTNTPYKK